jgi:hypothetical protein
MLSDITFSNNNRLNVRLPRSTVNELRTIHKKSSKEQREYGGRINLQRVMNKYAKFNAPNQLTGTRGRLPLTREVMNSYISYHTHPSSSNRDPKKKYFTLPSPDDVTIYNELYPQMQANIIADEQGYYVIDILESGNVMSNASSLVTKNYQDFIRRMGYLNTQQRNMDGLVFYESTAGEWKANVIHKLNEYMTNTHRMSIRFYTYEEIPAIITLINKNRA